MGARPSKYPPEFREEAVELVRATDKTIAEVARDLQINDTTPGNWVPGSSGVNSIDHYRRAVLAGFDFKADRAERGVPDATGLLPLTAAERAELTKLRKDVAKLGVEREILKNAAALFVTESTR